jgi:PPP family 3-phenylpropionic acid transporter
VRLWGSAGFLLTVLLAGAWFEQRGMSAFPFWVSGTLLAVVLSTWTLADRHEVRSADQQRQHAWPVLRQPPVAWFFLSVFLHVLAHVFVYSFFSLYLDRLGYSKTVIGLLWAASVVMEIGWFYTQGRWMRYLTLYRWLQLAAGLAVLRMALTAGAADWLWVLLVAQALHAVTFAAHHSACIAFVQGHFPGDLRGRGQALYAVLGYGVSGVIGSILGGWLSQHAGLSAVFWMATAVAAGAVWAARRAAQADARLASPASA